VKVRAFLAEYYLVVAALGLVLAAVIYRIYGYIVM
jgi:hypothetical protein